MDNFITEDDIAQIEKLGGAPVKSHPENIVRGGIRKPEAEPEVHERRGIQAAAREAPAVPQAPAAVRQPIRRPVSAPAPQADWLVINIMKL
mgnify:CR=1 FL=1